jgi:hypothetical protein
MGASKDLTGQKFHRLLVVSKAPSIAYVNKNGRPKWNCAWNCLCDCSNSHIVITDHLKSGNTKSCGCLSRENSKNQKMLEKLHENNRKFPPKIASARRVWQRYCYQDKSCNIDFDQFYEISQQNCTYCGIVPSNKFNNFNDLPEDHWAKLEGDYFYNGLDRVNSSLPHLINNCVAACIDCNRSKSNMTMSEFLVWIDSLQIKTFQPIDIESIMIAYPTNESLITSIQAVLSEYKKRDSYTDLNEYEFYSLSQLSCFYCRRPASQSNRYCSASNDKTQKEGWLHYNGLDRIDVNLPHNKNNIIPSCIVCNWAKLNASFDDFIGWIIRIQSFQNAKNDL